MCVLKSEGQHKPTDTPPLQIINDIFHHRLENTYKYQQAIMPMDYTFVERYLQLNQKKYLLEYAVKDKVTGKQLREDYSLQLINQDTFRVSKAKYLQSAKTDRPTYQLSSGVFTDYPQDHIYEANTCLITQSFDPIAVLDFKPGAYWTGSVHEKYRPEHPKRHRR